jgi:RNA polymerase sigma-70 factor (ECF subfamily)
MPVLEQQSGLLQQFAHGEVGAFETLFRQYQSEVYCWTVRIVRDPAAAEDLTIETFWRIYRAHARFDPERSFGAWARRIATNAALDHLKSLRREIALPEDSPAPAPPDPVVQRDLRERIRRAFRQLPAKLQVAVTLALIEEQSYKEIAEALDISVGAVKLRVFRGLRHLRKHLKQLGVEP